MKQNVFALTQFSNNFGKPVKILPGEGCQEILKQLNERPKGNRNIDQKTTLTLCTVSHNPFDPKTDFIPDVPTGFTSYFLYIDLSGDKVTFSDALQKQVGSEIYMRWKSDGLRKRKPTGLQNTTELVEGVVATVVNGAEYSPKRNKKYNATETDEWHRKLDKDLKDKFRSSYF